MSVITVPPFLVFFEFFFDFLEINSHCSSFIILVINHNSGVKDWKMLIVAGINFELINSEVRCIVGLRV
jgi:hypothetical protein